MKLEQILSGRVMRIIEVSGPGEGMINAAALARGCEERYSFLQGPRVVSDYNLESGVTFLRGYFNGRIIERFQIFQNGLLAEAETDTHELDFFLDDFTRW